VSTEAEPLAKKPDSGPVGRRTRAEGAGDVDSSNECSESRRLRGNVRDMLKKSKGFEDRRPEEVAVIAVGDGAKIATEAGSSGTLVEIGEMLERAAEALESVVSVQRALRASDVGGENGVAVGVVGSAVLGWFQENGIDEVTGGEEIGQVTINSSLESLESVY
jgi:hypothetical protein